MPKELELKGYKKSIGNKQQNKDPQHDTEDPQKDQPEVIFEGQDVSECPMAKIWIHQKW